MIATTPSGTRTCWISSPLGRTQPSRISPTGSGSDGDLAQTGRHRVDAGLGEPQPVERAGLHAAGRRGVEVGAVGGEDLGGVLDEQVGGREQRRVLRLGRRRWRAPGTRAVRASPARAPRRDMRRSIRESPDRPVSDIRRRGPARTLRRSERGTRCPSGAPSGPRRVAGAESEACAACDERDREPEQNESGAAATAAPALPVCRGPGRCARALPPFRQASNRLSVTETHVDARQSAVSYRMPRDRGRTPRSAGVRRRTTRSSRWMTSVGRARRAGPPVRRPAAARTARRRPS